MQLVFSICSQELSVFQVGLSNLDFAAKTPATARSSQNKRVPWRKEKAPQRKLIQALSLKTNGDESEVEQKESAKPSCESLQVKKFH